MHIVRTIFLWRGTAYQRLAHPQSRRPARLALQLSLAFGNDFADLFEVRGMQRASAAA